MIGSILKVAGRALKVGAIKLGETLAGGLLERALPTRRPKKRAPTELDSADVAIQNRASHPPAEHKVPAKVTQLRPPPRSSRYDD